MSVTKFTGSSISSGSKSSGFWDGKTNIAMASRSLGTFTTSGNGNPHGSWTYFQGMGCAFPEANVFIVTGSYNSNYTTNGNTFTIANGGGSWTSRTTYPTSVFQTDMLAFEGKVFVFGGNGLNGTAGGGSTSNTYYIGTNLSGWTAGTAIPVAGSTTAMRIPGSIIIQSGGIWYKGNGTSAWTATTSPPGFGSYTVGNIAYSFGGSKVFITTTDWSKYTVLNVAQPVSSSPSQIVSPAFGNAATSIYLFYDTEYTQTPSAYYFNGSTYTLTNNYGTQRTDGLGSAIFAYGINGNQITFIFGASGYRYATIN